MVIEARKEEEMDIVLEICDYFLLDAVYAKLFPKKFAQDSVQEFGRSAFSTEGSRSLNGTLETKNALRNMPVLIAYILNKVQSIQNKEDIYGLEPRYLPYSSLADASIFPRSSILREFFSLFLVTVIFGWILYFSVAGISYCTVFDKKVFNHPRYLKNQMSLEIYRAMTAIPIMVFLTVPFFVLELNGFSKLYMNVDESTGGWKAILLQFPSFILFTDCGIYLIHRWLHWPSVYKYLHKPHHKWIVCTPFASHAFHPVDGWAQSLPYHIFPMLFPLHKVSYLMLFSFVNFWTVMIHDGQYLSNDPVVNGTACHTVHHLYFNYNYGQFTTMWDRIGRSYRRPDDSLFARNTEKEKEAEIWKEQVKQMEDIRAPLEGKDDREYLY